MPFRIPVNLFSCPKQTTSADGFPSRCGGLLELVKSKRSKQNAVFRCLRCKTGVALPTNYVGKCRKYSDSTWNELVEEVPKAGFIGPKCLSCELYNPATMAPNLHVVNLKRCPMLDLTHLPTKPEFETWLAERYGTGISDVDPEEGRKDSMKRLDETLRRAIKWPN